MLLGLANVAAGQETRDFATLPVSAAFLLPTREGGASRHVVTREAAPDETDDETGNETVPEKPSKGLRSFRPTLDFKSEWLSRAGGVELLSYELRSKFSLYPWYGPPPPALTLGFQYTDLLTSPADLPRELYTYTVGASWIRPINDRWTLRFEGGTALATDGDNMTSDAWQFRGSALATYDASPELRWIVGLVALPRGDLAVFPALGLTWTPNPDLRLDLVMPRPRLTARVSETRLRQQSAFVGLELGGGTWAIEGPSGADERLSYGDWRAVLGWQSKPRPTPGQRSARGASVELQVGYAFARELEFDGRGNDRRLSDAWLVNLRISF